jgi:hypothetical protein
MDVPAPVPHEPILERAVDRALVTRDQVDILARLVGNDSTRKGRGKALV